MNERIKELANEACDSLYDGDWNIPDEFIETLTKLIIKECANELREAEDEADRAYKAGVESERNTFNGHDCADLLEERFGVE